MNETVVTVDIREDVRQGREPCSKIMQAVARLQDGEDLRLIAPFEPVPLFAVMARKGFSHQATPLGGGDWEVRFSRTASPTEVEEGASAPPAPVCGCGSVVEVDARGLEPPQPMVRILEALAHLPAGATLRARTDRKPVHLYAQLEARGFRGESEEQADGSCFTHIRRA